MNTPAIFILESVGEPRYEKDSKAVKGSATFKDLVTGRAKNGVETQKCEEADSEAVIAKMHKSLKEEVGLYFEYRSQFPDSGKWYHISAGEALRLLDAYMDELKEVRTDLKLMAMQEYEALQEEAS